MSIETQKMWVWKKIMAIVMKMRIYQGAEMKLANDGE